MNRLLGLTSAAAVGAAVVGFALSMLVGQEYASYATSMALSWAYVLLACSFSAIATKATSVAAHAGTAFAILYAGFATTVYFVQLTTVLHQTAPPDILKVLSYQELGSLMFNLELLGYGLMALSTFFVGLTTGTTDRVGWWLKVLLIAHGAFAPICVAMPMLNVFGTMPRGAGDNIGVMISFAWCVYFLPVTILAFLYLRDAYDTESQANGAAGKV
jgi:hypothetical protein